ncbi:MAG: arylsulfotransferase family protein [Haloarculaceae archaeon]
MPSPSKRALRAAFAVVVAVSAVTLAYSFASTATGKPEDVAERVPTAESSNATNGTTDASASTVTTDTTDNATAARNATTNVTVPESDVVAGSLAGKEVTVVATQGFYVSDERAEILAVTHDGSVVYFDNDYRVYFDVDPVEGKRYTVEYVAAKHFNGTTCEAVGTQRCTRNVVVRANLTTGQRRTVYAKLTPRIYSARWHDVDRLDDHHLVVADIVNDRVYTVDTRTDEITWQWNASEHYSRDAGGKPGDWTHVNDVEVLDDGRIMVSLRNMDQVVFLEPGEGIQDDWTLGTDDDHSILFEQHNPDYIPPENGGPSVLVADSENNRIVEYHRTNGTWTRTWTWRDAKLQWPRDADRLPNGDTLLVDTHGDRVLEVGPTDRVVWSLSVGMPYDVERLGTGDESTGGPVASRRLAAWRNATLDAGETTANGTTAARNGTAGPGRATGSLPDRLDRTAAGFWLALKTLAPGVVVNGLLYVSPQWVHFSDLGFAFVLVVTALAWVAAEFYWSSYSIRGFGRWMFRRVRTARR